MNAEHYDPHKLKALRERSELTQEQVADLIKVHRQTVYRAETGQAASYELLCALCRLYKTDVIGLLHSQPMMASQF